jgi:hypothetical protein
MPSGSVRLPALFSRSSHDSNLTLEKLTHALPDSILACVPPAPQRLRGFSWPFDANQANQYTAKIYWAIYYIELLHSSF